jgi:hypothetical protein
MLMKLSPYVFSVAAALLTSGVASATAVGAPPTDELAVAGPSVTRLLDTALPLCGDDDDNDNAATLCGDDDDNAATLCGDDDDNAATLCGDDDDDDNAVRLAGAV